MTCHFFRELLELVINNCLPWRFIFQLLVKHGGDLFAENENKDTPCDCAEKQHHKELALNLESRMVFSRDPEAESIEAEYAALDKKEVREYFKSVVFYKFIFVAVTLWQKSVKYAAGTPLCTVYMENIWF